MGASYGAGILSTGSLDNLDGDEQIQFLKEFAAEGHSPGFREVLGERVVELSYEEGEVDCRFLDQASAAPIIAAAKNIGGNAPSSLFPICLPSAIMLPGCRGTARVKTPAGAYAVSPLRNCIDRLREFMNEDDDSPEEEFARKLLEQMELCREHGLIFAAAT